MRLEGRRAWRQIGPSMGWVSSYYKNGVNAKPYTHGAVKEGGN